MWKIIPGNAQHIGRRREQQDAFAFSDFEDEAFRAHGGVLALVADGMGGMALGREAAQTAVKAMLEAYRLKTPDESVKEALLRALRFANEAVYRMAEAEGVPGESGCTLVAAVVHDEALDWVSVGDSRLYLLRDGKLQRLTEDHCFGRKLDRAVRMGLLSEEEALFHPEREALTSFVGIECLREIEVSEEPLPLRESDRLLLCSDGLYRTLLEEEIEELLSLSPPEAAERLVQKALEKDHPYQDNVTVEVLGFEEEGKNSRREPSRHRYGPGLLLGLALAVALFAGGGWAAWHSCHRFFASDPVKAVPTRASLEGAAASGISEGQ